MRSLADFKRAVKEPNTKLTLIGCYEPKTEQDKPHKYLNIVREVKKTQTNGVYLVSPERPELGGCWLQFDKATNWLFNGNLATYTNEFITLVYRVEN